MWKSKESINQCRLIIYSSCRRRCLQNAARNCTWISLALAKRSMRMMKHLPIRREKQLRWVLKRNSSLPTQQWQLSSRNPHRFHHFHQRHSTSRNLFHSTLTLNTPNSSLIQRENISKLLRIQFLQQLLLLHQLLQANYSFQCAQHCFLVSSSLIY